MRPAVPGDLPAVAAVYAPYVEGSLVTFETEPPDAATWRERFDWVAVRGLPFLVAEIDENVVG